MVSTVRVTAASLLIISVHHVIAQNMNGKYTIANSETYSSDYDAEYFEVYSPVIKSQYSEVIWRMMDSVPLPQDVQDRFDGKSMAITGYEVDQVQRTPSGDVPVPITWAYNHHYLAFIRSRNTKFVKKKGKRVGIGHDAEEYWETIILDDPNPEREIPLTQFFSEANGGEFRMSYHGYPKGYAQIIESPESFVVNPMQIDTWNRQMVGTKYMPGPLPKTSHIPTSAGYSGLIECPCSDRLKKEWHMKYALESSKKCDAPIKNAAECFEGARQVIQSDEYLEKREHESGKPSRCYIQPHADGSTDVVWNKGSNPSALTDFDMSRVVAFTQSQVNLTVAIEADVVTITMVGPSDKWFGVGFNSDSMCVHMQADECPTGGPYAIIIEGSKVVERKLDFHGPGTVLEPSVTLESMDEKNGVQTVTITRPLIGSTSQHYSFDASVTSLPVIAARGCEMTFSKHCGHAAAELNFFATERAVGICEAGITGTIGGKKFDNNRCAPFPKSDLLVQNNPTCHIQDYRGGLNCCHDSKLLLDEDQENPWPGQYLEYQLKFRFYFEEYSPNTGDSHDPSHQNLVRLYWQTESFAGEYDIVQCDDSMPRSQCVQVITSRWKVRDMLHDCRLRPDGSYCTGKGSTNPDLTAGVELIYAGPHCHAPTCLSMELYNADTGRLLCRMEPTRGQSDQLYDEHGFLAIPPCLWGNESEGLQAPGLLSLDTTLLSIKHNNNTLDHTGEMASWQMRGVVIPKSKITDPAQTPLVTGRRGSLRSTENEDNKR